MLGINTVYGIRSALIAGFGLSKFISHTGSADSEFTNSSIRFGDNEGVRFGNAAQGDAVAYYDTANFIIDPDRFGSGRVKPFSFAAAMRLSAMI